MTLAPWQMNQSQYQSSLGVHQPHIAEISPMQYAYMSKRQQAAYDVKRAAEWDASANCKQQWADLVYAAFLAGEFSLTDPTASREAIDSVRLSRVREQKMDVEARLTQAQKDNNITSPADVEIGDRVFDLLRSRYGTVVKKFAASIVLEKDGQQWKTKAGACQWLHYNELKQAVEANEPTRPRMAA